MTTSPDLVVWLIGLNGGRIVGKTRLQKIVYLLDNFGFGSGFDFDYHNFGPFSPRLAIATDFAEAQRRISVTEKPGFHEVPYSEFTTSEKPPEKILEFAAGKIVKFLNIMEKFSAIELELAATIAYLLRGGVSRSKVDITVRKLKPRKASDDRLQRAHKLLAVLSEAS